jgi:asparagine synthase (glutamine-hydrolysing)
MSGFVVVANVNGAPIDPTLMRRMTDALLFRGPDSNQIWIGEGIGFGHALFQIEDEPPIVRQPCSIDGEIWITGDIRVDAREDLIRALMTDRGARVKVATDPELILHAYQAWGETFLERLIGDFTFAIWDGPKKRLLCARDQFGVKPLFYAQVGSQLLISNTLSCIKVHPLVSDELNDAAIGDFLLFGSNWDPATTTYTDIKRLPGAHQLSWSPGKEPRIRRYWSIPVSDELRLPRPGEYVERFTSLLREATADRLPAGHVGVQMSGGLDSSMIASTAQSLLAKNNSGFEVRAHTIVYDSLIEDEERQYAGLVADHLRIPIKYLSADSYPLLEGDVGAYPEPSDTLTQPQLVDDFNRQVAAGGRVALTGFDGDAALAAHWPSHFAALWRHQKFGRLPADAFRYAQVKHGLAAAFARRLRWPKRQCTGPSYPNWLNPILERKRAMKDLLAHSEGGPDEGAPGRADAYEAMIHPNWFSLLESLDAGTTGVPLERRHPLLDLRLVEFLLALPAVPWCVDKHIFRVSMQDMLPRKVLRRPKSPLADDPWAAWLSRHKEDLRNFDFHPSVEQYVDKRTFGEVIDQLDSNAYWFSLRLMVLSRWFATREGIQR